MVRKKCNCGGSKPCDAECQLKRKEAAEKVNQQRAAESEARRLRLARRKGVV